MMSKILGTLLTPLAIPVAIAQQDLSNLPNYDQWLQQANDIKKYWVHPDALGNPLGLFPTWRSNDGTLRFEKADAATSAQENADDPKNFDFTRMISRQTFAYGALFNLTGDPKLLEYHKLGVKFLMEQALDPRGGFHSRFYHNGVAITNDQRQRTAQDLAYAMVGLAMNAYLTGNREIIDTVIKQQQYIYQNYYDPKLKLLKWTLEDSSQEKADQLELVAQLDQLNAYMILLWPQIPARQQKQWAKTIRLTIDAINQHFYNAPDNSFYGCIQDDSCRDPVQGKHLDYGHRVKTFWMEYLAALRLNDQQLIDFARQGMYQTLTQALQPTGKNWYQSSQQEDASWWVYAELDQSALTLALSQQFQIPNTFHILLTKYTDKKYGEWKFGQKTHLWRSGFHSTEHTLIGTILSSALQGGTEPVRLYFAPADAQQMIYRPYLYKGDVDAVENLDKGITKVTFKNIGLPDPVK